MKHGKREMPRQCRNKKGMTALVALVLIFCCSVGGTLAWLAATSGPVTNTFKPTAVKCVVNETINEETKTKSDVYVSIPEKDGTTDTTDAYVRAAIIVNWVDQGGNVYGVAPEQPTDGTKKEYADYTMEINDSDWTLSDGYYYYNSSVAPGRKTNDLIETCTPKSTAPDGYHLQVTILAEAIQANPESAVADAWRMKFSNNSWGSVGN